ncbi:phage tail family protein [Paenibacillus sp. P96]|uniref:Phage tail family protein n=1 Tax=Paenibacillus zeirhizosphaerae TaxID=2987519 RepID=A0ABT9FL68_9BACL|nr:phage tail domain-containing protein [Paenibacillus sp. P96]MDP4095482.1 phage tail family protein [Paenibacillus sp. P96]
MFGGGYSSLGFNTGAEEGNVLDFSAHLSGSGTVYSRKVQTDTDDYNNAFNQMSFNVIDEGTSFEYFLEFALDMTAATSLSGEGSMQADFTREYTLEADGMSGEARMQVDFIRDILTGAKMSGEGRVIAANANRYHTDFIEFVGGFAPGDRIIIDSNKLKITKNGQNVLYEMQGNFFDLNLGDNTLTWTDSETGRQVLCRITWSDRFV